MLLSAQAARMGTVSTTLREIGKKANKNRFVSSLKPRFKSTSALFADDREQPHLVREPWMVNLGRVDDSWLKGPRSKDWFTGKHPSECPGKLPSADKIPYRAIAHKTHCVL